MAKNIPPKIYYVGDFLPFLDLLQPLKLYKNTEILKLVKNWFQKCIFCGKFCKKLLLACLESAYSLIWGSHKIWGKGGGDTLDLL